MPLLPFSAGNVNAPGFTTPAAWNAGLASLTPDALGPLFSAWQSPGAQGQPALLGSDFGLTPQALTSWMQANPIPNVDTAQNTLWLNTSDTGAPTGWQTQPIQQFLTPGVLNTMGFQGPQIGAGVPLETLAQGPGAVTDFIRQNEAQVAQSHPPQTVGWDFQNIVLPAALGVVGAAAGGAPALAALGAETATGGVGMLGALASDLGAAAGAGLTGLESADALALAPGEVGSLAAGLPGTTDALLAGEGAAAAGAIPAETAGFGGFLGADDVVGGQPGIAALASAPDAGPSGLGVTGSDLGVAGAGDPGGWQLSPDELQRMLQGVGPSGSPLTPSTPAAVPTSGMETGMGAVSPTLDKPLSPTLLQRIAGLPGATLESLAKDPLRAGLAGLSVGANVMNASQAAQANKIARQANALRMQAAQPAASFAQQELTQAQTGTLSPTQQAAVDKWKSDASGRIEQYLANAGLSNSTMAAQWRAWVDQQALAMTNDLLTQTAQTGLQAAGVASGAAPAGMSPATMQASIVNAQNTLARLAAVGG